MDQTDLNVLKMLEPKKYDKPKKKIPLNKLFDMVKKKKNKKKKKPSYWLAGVCCKNTTLESWILSVIVPSGSNIRTLKESIINGCPLWI